MGRFSNVLLASDFDHTLTDMSGQIQMMQSLSS